METRKCIIHMWISWKTLELWFIHIIINTSTNLYWKCIESEILSYLTRKENSQKSRKYTYKVHQKSTRLRPCSNSHRNKQMGFMPVLLLLYCCWWICYVCMYLEHIEWKVRDSTFTHVRVSIIKGVYTGMRCWYRLYISILT